MRSLGRAWLVTLDTYTNQTYGRAVSSAVVAGSCVCCGKPIERAMNPAAAARYPGTGLCARCHGQHAADRKAPAEPTPFPAPSARGRKDPSRD